MACAAAKPGFDHSQILPFIYKNPRIIFRHILKISSHFLKLVVEDIANFTVCIVFLECYIVKICAQKIVVSRTCIKIFKSVAAARIKIMIPVHSDIGSVNRAPYRCWSLPYIAGSTAPMMIDKLSTVGKESDIATFRIYIIDNVSR